MNGWSRGTTIQSGGTKGFHILIAETHAAITAAMALQESVSKLTLSTHFRIIPSDTNKHYNDAPVMSVPLPAVWDELRAFSDGHIEFSQNFA
jgi:hypothetical protein